MPLSVRDVRALPGPGARADHPLRRRAEGFRSRRDTTSPLSRATRERGTTRSKAARSARSRTAASTSQ
jgi:hypothetical protein